MGSGLKAGGRWVGAAAKRRTRWAVLLVPVLAALAGERSPAPPALGLPPSLGGSRLPAAGAYEREWWFRYERSLPTGVIPPGAEHAARVRAALHRARARRDTRGRAGALAAAEWEELGPRGLIPFEGRGRVSGRMSSLLLLPGGRLVAGAASGGLWVRDPEGSFRPCADDAPSLNIGALAADPSDPRVLYAGTGEAGVSIDSFTGSGLLKSDDGGESWRRVDDGTFDDRKIARVWVDPRNPARLLAAALFRGLYESRDAGVTWRQLLAGGGIDFAVSPADPNRILFANSTPLGQPDGDLLLSTDGGARFQRVGGPWVRRGTHTGRIDVAFAPSRPGIVWAMVAAPAIAGRGGQPGVYRSGDGGRTWKRAFAAVEGSFADEVQSWYCQCLAVSPRDPDLVYLGAVNLYRGRLGGPLTRLTHPSTGGGLPYIHPDQHDLRIDPAAPDTFYVANDGGIYRSRDGGGTWSDLNEGLATVQFYGGAVARAQGLAGLVGGTQDNGVCTHAQRAPALPDWEQALPADGFQCAVDPQDPRVVYSSLFFSTYFLSSDGGRSFLELKPLPLKARERRPFITPITVDPNDPTRVYGAAQRVYRGASNRSNQVTWSPLSRTFLFPKDVIRRIAVAPSDGRVLYASGGPRLARTDRGGGAWSRVTPPGGQFITGVAVHPLDPAGVVCSRSGYAGGQMVRSRDGGRTWSDVTGDLPNIPANNVALRLREGRLEALLATDTGVYAADLDAAPVRWTPVGAGLPRVVVHDILLADGGAQLVAVTHGRGMWRLQP